MSPEACIRAYEVASDAHDLDAVSALIAEDAIYLFSNQTAHVGKTEITAAIRKNFELIKAESYRIDNLQWLLHTDEAAVCVYTFYWSGEINGKLTEGSGRGTSVLHRTSDDWLIVHEHLSKGGL